MKPVKINLVVKIKVWGKLLLGCVALIAFSTCAVTLVNTYDYFANTKVIVAYESRIKEMNQRSEKKRQAAQKSVVSSADIKKNKQNLDFFYTVIQKNIFSLPQVLSEIEKAKPQKINIHSLVFSKGLDRVKIIGESAHVASVSSFIVDLDRSKLFDVQLSKGEIREDKKIAFELIAKWTGMKYDQEI